MRRFFKNLFFYIGEIEIALSFLLVIIIIVSVFLQIIWRYLINMPLLWPEEFSMFLMIWMIFFMASYITKIKRHLALDYFFNKLSPKLAFWISLVSKIFIIIFLICSVWGGCQLYKSGMIRKSTILGIPLFYYYMSIIVNGISMIVYLFYDFVITIIDKEFIGLRCHVTGLPVGVSTKKGGG